MALGRRRVCTIILAPTLEFFIAKPKLAGFFYSPALLRPETVAAISRPILCRFGLLGLLSVRNSKISPPTHFFLACGPAKTFFTRQGRFTPRLWRGKILLKFTLRELGGSKQTTTKLPTLVFAAFHYVQVPLRAKRCSKEVFGAGFVSGGGLWKIC